MKIKYIIIISSMFLPIFCMLLFFSVLIVDEDEEKADAAVTAAGEDLSEEVLSYQFLVEQYAEEYGIAEYVNYLLAIMEVESGGKGGDVMQSSESLGLPPDTLKVEASIQQGCKYFSELLKETLSKGCDINTAVQSYNYGGGYITYIANQGNVHTFELAQAYAKEKANNTVVEYRHPIAVEINGGWRYSYGNMFYVQLVSQFLALPEFDDNTVQVIFNEALKYEGWKYVYGGSNPDTSFDCSGLVQWCYGKAGIALPRTAQEQYEATRHIALKEAKPGDLIFFQGTYDTDNYITHVGIYAGNNRMYHAGDPIGYADITTAYWQEHFAGVGRIKR